MLTRMFRHMQNITHAETDFTYIWTMFSANTLVQFFEELNYWGTDGRTWKCGSSPFICRPCSSSLPLPFVRGDACHISCAACQRHLFPCAAIGLTLQTQCNGTLTLQELKLTSGPLRQRWTTGACWVFGVMWLISQQEHNCNVANAGLETGLETDLLSKNRSGYTTIMEVAIKDYRHHLIFSFVATQVFILVLCCHISIYSKCLETLTFYRSDWPLPFSSVCFLVSASFSFSVL